MTGGDNRSTPIKTQRSNGYMRTTRRRLNKLDEKVDDLRGKLANLTRDVYRIQQWMKALFDVDANAGPNTRPKVVAAPVILPGQKTL